MKKRIYYISTTAIFVISALALCLYFTLKTTRKTPHQLPALLVTHNYASLQKIGAQAIRPYSYPVALSPDGSMLLVKTKTANSFTLSVYKKDQLICKTTSAYSPWELTWDPYGKCIAYLVEKDTPGKFQLNLWWIDTNKNTVVSDPVTYNASFPVRWSPDGHRLSYIECNGERSRIIILAVNNRSSVVERVIPCVNPNGGYAWSQDSKFLVFSTAKTSPTISVYNFANNLTQNLLYTRQSQVRDLSWAPSSQFITAAIRLPKDEFYQLLQLSLAGKVDYCPGEDGDAKTPVWTQNVLSYILEKECKDSIWTRYLCSPAKMLVALQAGSVRIQNDGYNHLALPLIESGCTGPPTLFTLQKQSSLPGKSSNNILQNVRIDHIWLKNQNHAIPLWQWKNSSDIAIHKAIVFVHGGPNLHETGSWDPLRAAFAQNSFIVLAPNYSGSTGYGAKFEKIDDLDVQGQDLAASIHYLEVSQGIKKDNIIVVASSYGAQVLIRALRENPDLCGMIVFDSAFASQRSNIAPINYQGIVLAFHGLGDTLSPADVTINQLHQLFSHTVQAKQFYWRMFNNEAHGFNRISSLQEIYGTIISAFNKVKPD